MEEKRERQKRGERAISVWNWMGTLLLSAIPVVNIIMWIVWIITAKRRTRRNFAIASLILLAVFAAAIYVLGGLFGAQLIDFLRGVYPEAFAPVAP